MSSQISNIILFDTSIASENGGDHIIMDYCTNILHEVFPDSFFSSIPTHDSIGRQSHKKLDICNASIVCGTNLLSSQMNRYRQWNFYLKDVSHMKKTCLMGVGWWQYQDKPNAYTSYLLNKVLNNNYLHSVRDKYTFQMLNSIGIDNVVYTACPTMWQLSSDHCSKIPHQKADKVITTFTDYHKNNELDAYLINILLRNYSEVYFWIQSYEDYRYLKEMGVDKKVILVGANLKKYDEVLNAEESIDYVGTRLHAGIRALNYKKRSIILACDNRAKEISKDTGLEVIDRKDIKEELESRILNSFITKIQLPQDNINIWKKHLVEEVQKAIV